jgi:hypothetical protein
MQALETGFEPADPTEWLLQDIGDLKTRTENQKRETRNYLSPRLFPRRILARDLSRHEAFRDIACF